MILERYAYCPDCTLGRLGRYWTIEPPWKGNKPYESCIADGVYDLEPHHSPRFGKCFILSNEQAGVGKTEGDRTHILIHAANWADQLEGCIAIGMGYAYTERGPMVTRSQDAMARMLAEMGESATMIDIRPTVGACLTG